MVAIYRLAYRYCLSGHRASILYMSATPLLLAHQYIAVFRRYGTASNVASIQAAKADTTQQAPCRPWLILFGTFSCLLWQGTVGDEGAL